mmetsp:Transcript_44843/g.54277  ORF Transcript_44843/g.54277 Transcript_44843/m.54277 type:complete len:733 (-) Transcript_44843:403-2601(-)
MMLDQYSSCQNRFPRERNNLFLPSYMNNDPRSFINVRRKHKFRVIFRAVSLLFLVSAALIVQRFLTSKNNFNHHQNKEYHERNQIHESTLSHRQDNIYHEYNRIHEYRDVSRFLTTTDNNNSTNTTIPSPRKNDPCTSVNRVDNNVMLIPYILGVLYMFVAIAIVCDEFFVPSLEEMASENYMNLSMDVAGATLMAAGGSAPELFTSLIGTFKESEVGFGTIVGSAVFNVLFVIGMCAMFSKEVLSLTAWPLARDCAYYSMGLLVLAIFCGYSSPGEIELWEAVVQFILYLGYVTVMKFNSRMHEWWVRNVLRTKISTENLDADAVASKAAQPSTFRAGLLNMFMGHDGTLLDKAGIGMVSKISGEVDSVFKKIDVNGDGFIDKNELYRLFSYLDCKVSDQEITSALKELDAEHGKIDLKQFTSWYIKSEARLKVELKSTFDEYDTDKSGTIDPEELKNLLKTLGSEASDENIRQAFEETSADNDCHPDRITYNEFETWYTNSESWTARKSSVESSLENSDEEDADPVSAHLKPPKGGSIFAFMHWLILFPIIVLLCFSIPDVRQPGRAKWCFFAFFTSICWIGGFTYFMVSWAEVIGNTLGIPMVLMGLTFLAAGTSVPDLLSSVIVARMGEGDMAVSSSIGSNIFDITVGLPLPWMIYCLWANAGGSVKIGTTGMELSILILLAMLIAIITMIHCAGWKMTKTLGGNMFVLYFLYLAQAIYRELPLKACK